MTGLVDSHCHLDDETWPEGAGAVLERARAAGVEAFVAIGVGEDARAARRAIEIASQHDDVVAAIGVHPHDATTLDDALFEELSALLDRPRVAALGEIGLDFHYMRSPRDVQERVFRRLVGLARAKNKPIVVHTREAPAETLAVLEEEGARDVGGVIHCFSEDRAFAERALDLGFDLSFSGIVTFKNARDVQEVAAWAPIDRILVETDSPYLAPLPLRGKKCEPAFVLHTARRVAELRGLPFDTLAERTTSNARRRFFA